MKLQGKTAIVTGASSGIGEAVAIALAERGVKVTITGRRADRLKAVEESIRRAGGQVLAVGGDLRIEDDIKKLFQCSQEYWGRLDILINNAAVGMDASLHYGSTESWREMLEVNVLALAIATREALTRFEIEKGGHVVNISSTSGHRVSADGSFYVATKFAVRALTELLQQELAAENSRVRVSAISPGRVDTDFFKNPNQSATEPGNRPLLRPVDVAATILQILESPNHLTIHDVIMTAKKT